MAPWTFIEGLYTDIAHYLGGGFNKKAVWSRFAQINRHAAAVKAIVDNGGGDPWGLEFSESQYGKVHNNAEIEGMPYGVFFILCALAVWVLISCLSQGSQRQWVVTAPHLPLRTDSARSKLRPSGLRMPLKKVSIHWSSILVLQSVRHFLTVFPVSYYELTKFQRLFVTTGKT